MVLQLELVTAAEVAAPAPALYDRSRHRLLLQTDLRQLVPCRTDAILAGIFVNLVGILAADRDRQACAGGLEIIVGLSPRPRPEFLLVEQLGHHIFICNASATKI